MKTQKRSQSARAFNKGYQAGIEGRSRSLCPQGNATIRQTWLSGWREGRSDNWDGFTKAAQAQKLSNLNL